MTLSHEILVFKWQSEDGGEIKVAKGIRREWGERAVGSLKTLI